MKYAIIESGGKQYRAVEGESIDVDRMSTDVGEQVKIDQVLLVSDGDDVKIGQPLVKGAHVDATITDHVKGPKILVFKYRAGNNYRVKQGHRQQYTRLTIDKIVE